MLLVSKKTAIGGICGTGGYQRGIGPVSADDRSLDPKQLSVQPVAEALR